MADYLIKEETLTAIADSIREYIETTDDIQPEAMPAEIKEVYNKGYLEGTGSTPSTELPTPTISINSGTGVVTATVTSGSNSKSDTLELNTKAATTITPGTTSKTAVSKGYYTTGAVTVAGDTDLKASNIKKGVQIFNVTGTYEPIIMGGELTPTTKVGLNKEWPFPNYSPAKCHDVCRIGDVVIGQMNIWEPATLTTNKKLYVGTINPNFKPSSEVFQAFKSSYKNNKNESILIDFNPWYPSEDGNEELVIGYGRATGDRTIITGSLDFSYSYPVKFTMTKQGEVYALIRDEGDMKTQTSFNYDGTSSEHTLEVIIAYPLKLLPLNPEEG